MRRPPTPLLPLALALAGCAEDPAPAETADPGPHLTLPEHSECWDAPLSDEVCLAVVEEDGRYPGYSELKAPEPAAEDDPRLSDADHLWLTAEIERCACVCCHRSSYDGPGTYFWDVDFEPVWIDSASAWSLGVFAGWTDEADQTFPSSDPERLERMIEAEIDRRYDR